MKLSRKNMTKLLDSDFRKKVLGSVKESFIKSKKIIEYSRYITDSQIVHRAKEYEDDKNAYYGFTPIYPICAVMTDKSVSKKFFEFNTVNHFLRLKDGFSAQEVVQCILICMAKEDKSIESYDVKTIDDELAKIEKQYLEQ